MGTKEDQATTIARLGKRIAGLKQYAQNVAQILVDGVGHTPPELEAMYQKGIDDRNEAAAKRGEVHNLVVQTKRDDQARRAIDKGLRAWVIMTQGANSQAMVDFGFPPPKPRKSTVETKAEGIAKSKATRAARHTMGKKQKAKIKGTVPEAPSPPAPQPTGDPTGGPSPTAGTTPKA